MLALPYALSAMENKGEAAAATEAEEAEANRILATIKWAVGNKNRALVVTLTANARRGSAALRKGLDNPFFKKNYNAFPGINEEINAAVEFLAKASGNEASQKEALRELFTSAAQPGNKAINGLYGAAGAGRIDTIAKLL